MIALHKKVAGLTALGLTSAVSLLAGGVLLGSASADDGKPGAGVVDVKVANLRMLAEGEGVSGCIISFSRDLPPVGKDEVFKEGIRGEPGAVFEKNIAFPVDKTEVVASGAFTKALEAKPLTPEEVVRLKAEGKLIEMSSFTPSECKVIGPNGEVTLPDGEVVTPPAGAVFHFGPKKAQ